MISDAVKYAILADIKRHTFDDKISGDDLGKPFGMKSAGVRCDAINPLRCIPNPLEIASNSNGYWWATEPVHVVITIDYLSAKIHGIVNAINGLKECLARLESEKQGVFQESLQGRLL